MKKRRSFIILGILVIIAVSVYFISLSDKITKSASEYNAIEKRDDVYIEVDEVSITPVSLKYTAYNNTDEEKYYGVDYEIEVKENDEWKSYDVETMWIEIAVVLKPNSINSEEVNWENIYGSLEKGKYRIIKHIDGITVSDEFEIN